MTGRPGRTAARTAGEIAAVLAGPGYQTTAQIAARAGMSRATAARALHGLDAAGRLLTDSTVWPYAYRLTTPAPPGTRRCPGCGCCQFGLCMLAARDMHECAYLAADPATARGCPCSAVLRRPLVSAGHLWYGDRCRRCGGSCYSGVPGCWYHPHDPGRDRACRWCGLDPADPKTPLDCPGMPRATPVTLETP